MFLRRLWMAVPLVALAVATVRADNPRTTQSPSSQTLTCQIYALADLCDDAQFGVWVAKTIPEVIEPATWVADDAAGRRVLTYNPSAKVMIVYQTPKVHEAIAAFLKNMKQTMPAQTRTWAKTPILIQAAHTVPAPAKFADPAPLTSSSPMRTMADRPSHLFHIIVEGLEGEGTTYKLKNFTLRYEGDGIIDSNIVELIRSQAEIAAKNPPAPCPQCPAQADKPEASESSSTFQQLMRMLPFQTYTDIQMPKPTTIPSSGSCMPHSTYGPASNLVPAPCPAVCAPASSGFARGIVTGLQDPRTTEATPGSTEDSTLPGLPPRPVPIGQGIRPVPIVPELDTGSRLPPPPPPAP